MKKRLGVAVAALLLGAQMGSPIAHAEPAVEELLVISELIEAGDLESLIVYLEANPQLLEGDSIIAVRLRQFMAAAQDLATYLAFEEPTRQELAEQLLADLAAGGGRWTPEGDEPPSAAADAESEAIDLAEDPDFVGEEEGSALY